MEYKLRSPERELSFVITPVDTFSGCIATGNITATIDGFYKPPTVKSEGHFVFYDLPQGEYKITVSSDMYFTEVLRINTGQELTAALIPNRRYRLPKGTTVVEGFIKPDANLYIMPKESGIKLSRYADNVIHIITQRPWDLSCRYIAVGSEREICFVTERLNKYAYKLSAPFKKKHDTNDVIIPVSLGRGEKDGYLFCPLALFMPEYAEVLILCRENDKSLNVDIAYGTSNTIDFKQLFI